MAAQWQVRWYDEAASSVRTERVDAQTQQAAVAAFEAPGQVVLDVQAWPREGPPPRAWGGRWIDQAAWCRELRVLLGAGMTVVEAMDTLRAQALGTERARLHAELHEALQRGLPLSLALSRSGHFSPVLVSAVTASERTGSLVQALDDFLRYHELIDGLKRRTVSAAIYPCLVLGLGLVIVTVLLLFVMPRFASIYADMPGGVGGATAVLLSLSRLLSTHATAVVAGIATLLALFIWAARSGRLASLLAQAAEAMPPVRRRLDDFRLAQLHQSLVLMFRGGYPLDVALQRSAELNLGPRLKAGLAQARQDLMRGRRVSQAFRDAGLSDAVSDRLLQVGERTGDFDRVLQTIAERHAQRFSTTVERTTRLVEPVLLLLVALVVGGVVVLMYMPVFDIAASVR